MDSEYLKRFYKLPSEERSKIIKNGRPTPELQQLQQQMKVTNRKFQTSWYKRNNWLCGCITTNKLFCFPCLLFSMCSKTPWVKDGFSDLNNLHTALSKHERSAVHYKSQICWKTFLFSSRSDVLIMDKQKKRSIEIHNQKVKENREVLKQLICATCFLIKQEQVFCRDAAADTNDEIRSSSLNNGNYIELLKYTAKFDEKFEQLLQNSPIFAGFSHSMQNDLIEAISTVVENDIKEDIAKAPFIAIELNETANISNTSQCSTVLRYVLNYEVKEAFIGFDTLKDRTIDGITECIFNNLDRYRCIEKLIAQTYDGAIMVMETHSNSVQAKVREKAPSALFTHCYAHELNFVLCQSAKCIPECTSFFKMIEALDFFFSHSVNKQMKFLDEIIQKSIADSVPTKSGSSYSKLIQVVLKFHMDLCKFFCSINNCPLYWDPDTVVKSNGFYNWLIQDSTYFLLMVYDEILIKTDFLFKILQAKMMDILYCSKQIKETMHSLGELRKNFDDINKNFEKYCMENNLTGLKFCERDFVREKREKLFGLILDDIFNHMEARYSNLRNLHFISLVDSKRFKKFARHIDMDAFETLEKNYGNFFDVRRLKADLAGIYNATVFQDTSFKDLLAFLFKSELDQTFPEAVKLLQLILTIPAMTAFDERSFSSLKRIKSFTRNKMTDIERFSSLALISIEKERFTEMEQNCSYNFYEKVTDIFAINNKRGIELVYKKGVT